MAHMHYTGTGKVHSFRGLLGDGEVSGVDGQEKIRIQGSVGSIAWRITKFALMFNSPGAASVEHVVKIYREEQTTVDGVVDFTNDELLAAGFLSAHSGATSYPEDLNVIFDNALFVRNIWITHVETANSESCNYYIELEEVKVGKAGMAQLAVAAARRT